MIRVVKPDVPPPILSENGRARRTEHEADFLTDSAAFAAGHRRFDFDSNIYSADAVRSELSRAQHGKCCFCESKIQHISYGDVEHFRPKAAVKQARSAALERPGYYWMAYEWSNLYFCCQLCNQRNKESLFPLLNPAARVHSHEQDDRLEAERPLFIDPGVDDPERLLGFRENAPYPIDGNPRAQTTMVVLELGRVHLMERRKEHVELAEALLTVLEVAKATRRDPSSNDDIVKASALLAQGTRDTAEFTSMTRHFLRARLGSAIRMPLTTDELLAFVRGGALPQSAPDLEPVAESTR